MAVHAPSFLILAYFSSNLLESFSAILYRYEPSCRVRKQRACGQVSCLTANANNSGALIWHASRTYLVVVLAVLPHQPHVLRHLLVLGVVPALQPCLRHQGLGTTERACEDMAREMPSYYVCVRYLDGAQVHGLLDHDRVVLQPQRLPVHRLQEGVCGSGGSGCEWGLGLGVCFASAMNVNSRGRRPFVTQPSKALRDVPTSFWLVSHCTRLCILLSPPSAMVPSRLRRLLRLLLPAAADLLDLVRRVCGARPQAPVCGCTHVNDREAGGQRSSGGPGGCVCRSRSKRGHAHDEHDDRRAPAASCVVPPHHLLRSRSPPPASRRAKVPCGGRVDYSIARGGAGRAPPSHVVREQPPTKTIDGWIDRPTWTTHTQTEDAAPLASLC